MTVLLEAQLKELKKTKSLRTFINILDIIETMQELMPELFKKFLKIKDFPTKRAIEDSLSICQQFLLEEREYISESDSAAEGKRGSY